MNVIESITKTLNTVVSPMVYIMSGVSVVVGFTYAFLPGLPDIQNSILYKYGLLFDLNLWGVLLMVGAIGVIIGLRFRRETIIQNSALLCFMMWTFAGFTYLLNGYYYLVIVWALFHMVFYGYVELASFLGLIWREAIIHRKD